MVRLLDVLDTPLLVLLVLAWVRTDLGVVVVTLADDVEHFTSRTVSDDVAFNCPLLRRSTVVRLQADSLFRLYAHRTSQ